MIEWIIIILLICIIATMVYVYRKVVMELQLRDKAWEGICQEQVLLIARTVRWFRHQRDHHGIKWSSLASGDGKIPHLWYRLNDVLPEGHPDKRTPREEGGASEVCIHGGFADQPIPCLYSQYMEDMEDDK
jgi:hypothetical protein